MVIAKPGYSRMLIYFATLPSANLVKDLIPLLESPNCNFLERIVFDEGYLEAVVVVKE